MKTVAVDKALAGRLPVTLAALTVVLQIAYPLVHGHSRDVLTVVTVCTFFLASCSHALLTRGPLFTTLLVAVAAGFGLVAEAVGTRTGVPFGSYTYSQSLGWQVFGVPVVIPLAWAMFAYPCLLVGRRLARQSWQVPLLAGAALASWDLFLDPQMVEAGHWRWLNIQHTLPGIPTIPISNFLGWALVASVMMAVLHLVTSLRVVVFQRKHTLGDAVPASLFGWTYASSVFANAVFFGRPGVAVVGGLAMGVIAVPYALRCTGAWGR